MVHLRRLLGLAAALLLILLTPVPALAITAPELRGAGANAVVSPDMHGRQLQAAEYIKADLAGVDLSASDLTGAVFNTSDLSGADLRGAILRDVVAFASRFKGADLRNAVLENGLFMQSSFTDARINGADFTDAVVDRSQLPQLCRRADGHNSITDRDTRTSLNCPQPRS
ncbi:MAG: pentapeptide repeat-containing protein [Synechococcus sp. SB0676_bin_10]|uniref:Pentapeptide repeat-containing protein n=1 Tax=Synechococcus sp. SB0676_bin_10 TaxID=2604869 RepID=A0A6B1FBB9_9SYNE|nr:pentapeptide repeat-containing protein [Cyanobacteria bacterium MAG IRC3_bin_20]MDE0647266.1 pentapeptide repeat-containing protein [Cyanobacteria bacterium MAG IRC4_bin_6]MYG38554.1 pentapeptide repeat-containing protein [Synechococcus sp. SB0676_bin_10]MYK06470.1 pentapeptide repeat-containing protein [Synechococcus sp. SB0670_bin_20]